MKTLTVTDARKNLSSLLKAAAQGEDIGIVIGPDIIALRKVEVEASDYAWKEYGAAPEQLDRYLAAVEKEHQREEKSGKLKTLLFVDRPEALHITFLGSHDEVRKEINSY